MIPATPARRLWRNRAFNVFWLGQALSSLGAMLAGFVAGPAGALGDDALALLASAGSLAALLLAGLGFCTPIWQRRARP